jgi:hypothetical protein
VRRHAVSRRSAIWCVSLPRGVRVPLPVTRSRDTRPDRVSHVAAQPRGEPELDQRRVQHSSTPRRARRCAAPIVLSVEVKEARVACRLRRLSARDSCCEPRVLGVRQRMGRHTAARGRTTRLRPLAAAIIDELGFTPASPGHHSCVVAILESGGRCALNAPNRRGDTPAHLAAQQGLNTRLRNQYCSRVMPAPLQGTLTSSRSCRATGRNLAE